MPALDTSRHDALFNYRDFMLPIHTIGVGATGSNFVYEMAKLGCGSVNELHFWDGDIVEGKNLPSQRYELSDVKADTPKPKVQALGEGARRWTGITPIVHEVCIGKEEVALSGVVIFCVDQMSVRRDIWKSSVRGRTGVVFFIDIRIDAAGGLIFALDPNNSEHAREWERLWYPDEQVTREVGSCGEAITSGPTARMATSIATWCFMDFAHALKNREPYTGANLVEFQMRGLSIRPEKW